VGFEAAFLPLITSMFLHSGFLHLAGNMLFLWIFGDNVEDVFGHLPYLFFYLVCGLGAGLLHVLFNLGSAIPGARCKRGDFGVMGAYMVLFPRERILTLVFILWFRSRRSSFLAIGFCFSFLAGI